jgi:soluble lytic murein transglycosylase-like protein
MQIKLATARGLGYTGTAAGLHDPNTNLTYAVRYLAGAYRAANGNADRAVRYYAAGYYHAAKRQRRHHGGRHDAQAHATPTGTPLSILPPQ